MYINRATLRKAQKEKQMLENNEENKNHQLNNRITSLFINILNSLLADTFLVQENIDR